MKSIILCCSTVILSFLFLSGCKSYNGDFVEKTEAQLKQMEQQSENAHNAFLQGNYTAAAKLLQELVKERTVSRPLYQLELLSVLLMDEKYEEAHQLMLKLHEDIETLFDKRSEEKAQSVWHGEVNKVFKGDSYERATFYALLALSFIRKGNYEDALRSVKNGLLADADSNSANAVEDYALLHYIGYLAAAGMGDKNEAQEYLRGMEKAMMQRGFPAEDADGKRAKNNCFEFLAGNDCNVLLVVWTGMPPTIACLGDYKEIRSIVRGVAPFDSISVAVSRRNHFYSPNKLGDLEYQATTRGGREMDNILKDKATAKKTMEVSGNIFFVIGYGLVIAGARTMSAPPLGMALLCSGAGCYVMGLTLHVTGALMNPAADGRYWRNIPNQFHIVPLKLPAGQHQVTFTGYKHFDTVGMSVYNITVPEGGGMNVFHLPMMKQGYSARQQLEKNNRSELQKVLEKSSGNRFLKEIK